jgi:DNA polymerase III delta prime subunit
MSLEIHQNIKEKLKYFHKIQKIPNIIFNGPSGSGKSTILNEFISLIYDGNKEKINDFVMYVNCTHGKGIKFIREELKFFAKTHINSNGGDKFKSIVLFNGDKLTMDAQSALRRCIELFSHNTRFFIVVEDKYKLLKPILSRFCEIYISEPEYNGKIINLYKYNLDRTFKLTDIKTQRSEWLKKELNKFVNSKIQTNIILNTEDLQLFVTKLYEKAYSALDIIELIENNCFNLDDKRKYELLIAFSKIRKEIRNEKLLLTFIINFMFFDKLTSLENMTFI